MPEPESDYAAYLSAKRAVDDDALDRRCLEGFLRALPRPHASVVEFGSGTGAMLERLCGDELAAAREGLESLSYTGVEPDEASLAVARALGAEREAAGGLRVATAWVQGTVESWAGPPADGVVACALLDLLDVDAALEAMLGRALRADGGAFYLPVNFDGHTAWYPEAPGDAEAVEAYHASMDARLGTGGRFSGRRVQAALARRADVQVRRTAASTWSAFPPDASPVFLGAMLGFFANELGPSGLHDGWLAERRRLLEAGELGLVVTNLDFWGVVSRPVEA